MSAPEIEVIRLWIADGRSREVDSLRPAEIGNARHRDRMLDCAIIDGVLYIERKVAPSLREPLGRHLVEVYVADTIYAKNVRGVSSVSAPRMAHYLGLHERTIRRVRDLLVELRLQGRARQVGEADAIWPIIPRALATHRISRVWWLDATSAPSAAYRWPAGTPDTHRCPGLGEATPDTERGDPGHREGGTPDTERGDPGHDAYTSYSDINELASERRLRRLESDIGSAPAGALPMSAEARLAREMEALREQRPARTHEERARVAAMARQVAERQRELERQARDPYAETHRAAGEAVLRAKAGLTPERLQEALASLRRMQGSPE
jgi:hypothetical protein